MAGWLSKPNEHARVTALLSPYLDGQTSGAERALVERHLCTCAECARDLATLKAAAAAIRELPRVRAPRSFTLPRSMARQPQPAPRLVPALRGATALATVLFVIIVGGDVFLANSMQRAAAPPPALVALRPASAVLPAPTAALGSAPVAPQALDSATKAATWPALAAGRAALATPVETAVEQPVQPGGLGAISGNQPPAAAAPMRPLVVPTNQVESLTPSAPKAASATASPADQLRETAPTVTLEREVIGAPTLVARAPESQSSAESRSGDAATQVVLPSANPLRVAEGALALLALAFGVTAWRVNRRGR